MDNSLKGFINDSSQPSNNLVFSVQPVNTVTGEAINPNIVVQVEKLNGAVNIGYQGFVTLDLQTDPVGYTSINGNLMVPVVNGIAVFSGINLDEDALGFKLKATASNSYEAVSDSFNITGATVIFIGLLVLIIPSLWLMEILML